MGLGLLAAAAPAGGSSASEIISASIVAFAAITVVIALGVAHRKRGVLNPLATRVEQLSGQPAWSVLPNAVAGVGLLVAVFGYYWDVSWHIDRGRDPGAFANPAHWFIIIGLDAIAFAGILALILGDDRDKASVTIHKDWKAPVGAVLLLICGVLALAGFPLDDIWHRLFGQDVTAWGPTHIQMIGGASLATLAIWALSVQADRVSPIPEDKRGRLVFHHVQDIVLGGSFLIGLSTLQVEFDFGVPQFRQLYQPVLIALAAAIALVAVRIRAGRGAALGATAVFLLILGTLSFLIGPVLGRSTMHFPLYIVEALLVEAVALKVPRDRQLTLGVISGALIGTVGFGVEYAWSLVWMPLPWTTSMLPEGLLLTAAAGTAGGLIGGLLGRAIAPAGVGHQQTPRGAVAAAWVAAAACLVIPMPVQVHDNWTAAVSYRAAPGAGRQAFVDVRLSPAGAAKDANWFNVLSWQGAKQGDGGEVIAKLQRTGPGTYRTTVPVPLDGTWKTLLRLHVGSSMQALPLYLPADAAIPAKAVPAAAGLKHFQNEKAILQREATTDKNGLQRLAYALLVALAVGWIVSLGWGLRMIDPTPRRGGGDGRRRAGQPAAVASSMP